MLIKILFNYLACSFENNNYMEKYTKKKIESEVMLTKMALQQSARFTGMRPRLNNTFQRFSSSTSTSSSSSSTSGGPFGATRKESIMWFAKATAACGVLGYTLANHVLTEDNLHTVSKKLKDVGIELKNPFFESAHAFSLIENGMHPSHMPWDHHSWFKTYDHAA
jgi:hypothetical protein